MFPVRNACGTCASASELPAGKSLRAAAELPAPLASSRGVRRAYHADARPFALSAGQIAASIPTIAGVVVLAFPITMIVSNFSKEQNKQQCAKEGREPDEDAGQIIVKGVAIV